ncbi:hypothetical protein ABZ958_28545 [Streptomyces sp. NPDC046237]|uniref:hypothetical protein n=1 Tax=Streptomyces sp. NPDC046237 TaxID=3154914 RepID=UPI0033DDC8B0
MRLGSTGAAGADVPIVTSTYSPDEPPEHPKEQYEPRTGGRGGGLQARRVVQEPFEPTVTV